MSDLEKLALLPCPFCGGENVETFGPYGWYRQWGISHSCKSFYSGTSEMMQGFPSEAYAVTAWNTRSDAAIHSVSGSRQIASGQDGATLGRSGSGEPAHVDPIAHPSESTPIPSSRRDRL